MTDVAIAPELPRGTSARARFLATGLGTLTGITVAAGIAAAVTGGYEPTGITNTAAWMHAYWPAVVVPAGAVIAVFVVTLIWRTFRRQQADRIAVNAAVLLASAFSAQGMYEVATQRLHLAWWLASGLFVVAESAMLASAIRAHRHWLVTQNLGPHGRFVWIIASCAGFVVSLNAHSPSEYMLRLLMPLLVAGLWRMGYVNPEQRAKAADAITMRWTPRRLGILLGIIEPGDRDLVTVHAERRIRQLTTHAHALHHGGRMLSGYHAARLRRLALLADDDMIAEVQRRISRVHYVEASTAPRPPEEPGGTTPPAIAEVPTEGDSGSSARNRSEQRRRQTGTRDRNRSRTPRRSKEETQRLYDELTAQFPTATKAEIAKQLKITPRALRSALNA